MRVLVTGAAGMLGQDVARAAGHNGHTVAGLSHAELDVLDPAAVERALRDHRPEAVINCAAYTDVDGAESEPEQAEAVNGTGAGNLARTAAAAGVTLVHVSSDYVFDGESERPYVESDEARPLSAYGRSKLAGERAVAEAGVEHAIVRSAWLFGTRGHNFVETMLRLGAERGEVAVVTDQVGSPTWTGHLATALVDIAARRSAGLHHVAGAGQCSWNEFAAEIFRQAGVSCRVEPQLTEALGRPAPRPALSALDSERDDVPRLAPWAEGLAGYLAERGLRTAPTAGSSA